MSRFLGNSLLVVTLLVLFSILLTKWTSITDSPPVMLNVKNDNIDRVDVEFIDRRIYLNVYLNSKMSCREVIDTLGIKTFLIKRKTYEPTCSQPKDSFIRITYDEKIEV